MRCYKRVSPEVTVPWLASSGHLRPEPPATENTREAYKGPYQMGARVRLVGLTNATHLNGREGQVTGFIEESGVVHVELDACGGVKCPPMKLLAKFVEHHLETENTYTIAIASMCLHAQGYTTGHGDDGARAKAAGRNWRRST